MADADTSSLQSQQQTQQWASLADRLNPNRAAFDAKLKASWKSMSKKEKKKIISEDKKAIAALKSRATSQSLPFIADSDDHCETSHVAYMHVAPILSYIATRIGRESVNIYDPYYCAGTVIQHLAKLGFQNVYNKPEDFYQVIQEQRLPQHDVVVTNPPYSGDHFERLLKFLCDNDNNNNDKKKPALLLIPEHLSKKKSIQQYLDNFFFLTPPERYFYWTPEGLRPKEEKEDDVNDGEDAQNNKKQKKKKKKKSKQHKNLMLGSRNSPFASHWFIRTDPVVSNEEMISRIKRGEIQLVDGCNVYSRQEDIAQVNNFRKRKGQEVEVKNEGSKGLEDEIEQNQHQEEGQRKRRRKKKRVKKEDNIQAADGSNPFF
jgi:hypothetical protein